MFRYYNAGISYTGYSGQAGKYESGKHEECENNPSADGCDKIMKDLVKQAEERATSMFFYHLNAMGLDPWDFEHRRDECSQSVARLAALLVVVK